MADPKQLAAKVTTRTELEIIADLKKEKAKLMKEQAKFKREIAYLRNKSFVNNQAPLVQEEEEEQSPKHMVAKVSPPLITTTILV